MKNFSLIQLTKRAASLVFSFVLVLIAINTFASPHPEGNPVVSSFFPKKGGMKTAITIIGSSFTGATSVVFGTRPAATFTVVSDTQIVAVIDTLSTSGNLTVYSGSNAASLPGFTFLKTKITSFTPALGAAGDHILITGTDLDDINSVTFGGQPAASFHVVSSTQIDVVLASGSQGAVAVKGPYSTDSNWRFVFLIPPYITQFYPVRAFAGDLVRIYGYGDSFANATAVSFGGVPAKSFTVVSPVEIDAYVDSGASGAITITTPIGTGSGGGFVYAQPNPSIDRFTPASGKKNDIIVIYGNDFINVQQVYFGTVRAKGFTVNSSTAITATVDSGASGAVSVQTATKTVSLDGFTYGGPQTTITSFAPTNAPAGATVQITGTNFVNVFAVSFGGLKAKSFQVISPTQINAVVDTGRTGDVVVQSDYNTAVLSGFTFQAPQTTITSFAPATAYTGNTVQISGTNFVNVSEVSFGGVRAKSFQVISSTQINAVVDTGRSGDVVVKSNYNTATSAGFIFQPPPPTITTINPYVAKIGDPIVITGTNFTTATAVTFGGVAATSFQVNSDTQITAILGDGDDGDVVVTTKGGQGTYSGFMFNSPPPKITSVSSLSGGKGTVITITGNYLNRVNNVTFGGTYASGIQIISRNEIQAQVDYGSSGYVAVFSPLGIDSIAGFTYTHLAPVISNYEPNSVTEDVELIISGDNVGYATAVTIGGVPVKSIKVFSPGLIHVFVGAGKPGAADLVITTPDGSVTTGLNFYAPQPQVYSFSPLMGSVGTVVTVKGKYLNYAKYVDFLSNPDLKSASSFEIISDSVLKAVIDTACAGMLGVGNDSRSYGWSQTPFDYKEPMQPTVTPSGSNPVSGTIDVKVIVDSSVQEYNGNPYVQRHYDIEPENNPSTSTALVTLYFFQYEFDNYNLVPNHGADLPTGPTDDANKANLRIFQYHGFSTSSIPGTYDGLGIEINPDDNNIVWNAATQMWEVSFQISGFSGFFVASMGSAILPLKLISFSAQQKESNVILNWKTADEKNVDHFEVLKSTDGAAFNRIATVKSLLQTGENTYSYNDPSVYSATTYYRLKIVDSDGKFSLSKVVKVVGTTDKLLSLYPNPAKGKVTITYAEAKENTQIKVVDLSGRILKIVKAEKGSTQTTINLQGVATGTYKLVWSDGKQTIVKSLIVE